MHRKVDVVAESGLHAPQQRHQHGRKGHASRKRDRRPVCPEWPARHRLRGSAEHAGHGFDRQIVRGRPEIGAVLAERADRAIDDAGIARPSPLIVDAETRNDAGRKHSTKHVGRVAQSRQDFSVAAPALRSSTTLFLPRSMLRKKTDVSPVQRPDMTSVVARPGASTLIDLGAMVGHRRVRYGPGRNDDRSMTRIPCELHAALPVDAAYFRVVTKVVVVGAERGARRIAAAAPHRP